MKKAAASLKLLPAAALVKTGDVDHADWNYRPLLGQISRARYKMVVRLLNGTRAERLLEIGYGSGVFMPELARHAQELYGIDIHQDSRAVTDALAAHDVEARLFSGSAAAMPFAENFFETIVAVSSLEFVDDLKAACAEIKRVLKRDGYLVVVTPGYSPLVDFGLKLMTGESAKKDYDKRREQLLPTLLEYFEVEAQRTVPPLPGASLLRLYTALKLRAK